MRWRPEHTRQDTLNLKAGQTPVDLGDVPWMRQLPAVFGETLDPSRVARVFSLEDADLDERYPIQETSTGLPATIVPLKDLDALKCCRVDRERYFELVKMPSLLYLRAEEREDGTSISVGGNVQMVARRELL
ncbi:hypothetical protein BH24ACT19_BH24ACT19_02070 [soil metagenome]